MKKSIIIAADIVPTKSNYYYFKKDNVEQVVSKEIISKLQLADFVVMNLEVPLVNKPSPIRKCGPCLMAPTKCVEGIKSINPHFFTLANNHIMDQGVNGLKSTISTLRKHGISFAGAGKNINEAKEAIPKGLNIILEITYYKLYMKMMNPYERIINLRNLNHRLDNLEQQINNNQIEINNQQIKLEKQKEDFQERMIKSDDKLGRIELQIKKLIEEINYLKRNQKESVNNKLSESNKDVKNNNNENKGNEQDNNVKNKINSITSVENIEITFTKK